MMSGKMLGTLVVGAIALSMLPACNTADNIEYGMTEEEAAQMAELGYVNVDNVADASRIAGYAVAVPDYIPEGFIPESLIGGVFSVSQLGATLPEGIGAEDKPVDVYQSYTWQEDNSVRFDLTQVNLELSLGESEPAEFCGYSGARYYREAEVDMPAIVVLGWEVDGISYYLTGTLAGPLDEATLEQIACSVEVDS